MAVRTVSGVSSSKATSVLRIFVISIKLITLLAGLVSTDSSSSTAIVSHMAISVSLEMSSKDVSLARLGIKLSAASAENFLISVRSSIPLFRASSVPPITFFPMESATEPFQTVPFKELTSAKDATICMPHQLINVHAFPNNQSGTANNMIQLLISAYFAKMDTKSLLIKNVWLSSAQNTIFKLTFVQNAKTEQQMEFRSFMR
jgi:hypothetical protein